MDLGRDLSNWVGDTGRGIATGADAAWHGIDKVWGGIEPAIHRSFFTQQGWGNIGHDINDRFFTEAGWSKNYHDTLGLADTSAQIINGIGAWAGLPSAITGETAPQATWKQTGSGFGSALWHAATSLSDQISQGIANNFTDGYHIINDSIFHQGNIFAIEPPLVVQDLFFDKNSPKFFGYDSSLDEDRNARHSGVSQSDRFRHSNQNPIDRIYKSIKRRVTKMMYQKKYGILWHEDDFL
jgi:hypothetical protein